jgi:myo-inositol-1(or 4)-monophosphatase
MSDREKYMEIEDSEYFEELRTAFKAAEEAGEIIDKFFRNGFDDWEKDDGSAVTEADLRSQEKIVEMISEEFPGDGFLGEEEHLEPEGEERVWVIDPLDGTANFEKGSPFFAVSIALEIDSEQVVGVVLMPESSLGETYFAVRDGGAFVTEGNIENRSPIEVSDLGGLENGHYFLTTFDIFEGELDAEKDLLESFAREKAWQRQLGAAAVELCFLASGKVDFLVNPIEKKVDYSAGKLVVEEAGGSVRIRSSKFEDAFEVVASNGLLQEEVEDIVGERFVD